MAGGVDNKAGIAGVFGRSASTYDTVIPFFTTFAGRLVEATHVERGDHVLDLACGRGACMVAVAQETQGRLVGVDLAPEMVEALQKDLAAAGLSNAEAITMDAEALDFEDASFDVVLCGFSVFFFPDPHAALREVHRVLRPGGRFGATTFVPERGGYPWLKQVAEALGRPGGGPPQSPVGDAEGLEKVLADLGFAEIHSVPVDERFVFPDVDAFVDWNWSHGGRRILEQLSDEELALYRSECDRHLRQHHTVEGGYELLQGASATVAQKP